MKGGGSVDERTASLDSALDALLADDASGLFGPALLERLRALVPALHRLTSEVCRTVHEAESAGAAEFDGLTTMRSWLRGNLLLDDATAAGWVHNGRTLAKLPVLARAHAAGAVSARHVAAFAPMVTDSRLAAAAEAGVDLPAMEAAFVHEAMTHQPAQVTGYVAGYLAGLEPDGAEPDPTEGRSLSMPAFGDGRFLLRGELDVLGGETLKTALESIVQAHRPKGDTRTVAQQWADALVQLAANQLAGGALPTLRTTKPQVIVTLDIDDLVDEGTGAGAASTGYGQQISAARARMLACDGEITRIVIGPDGAPLDVGRTFRVVTPAIRRAVEHRDKSCVFTGCGAPTYWCEVHHLIHWAFGGETSLANSGLLCERHHTKVHNGYTIERDPTGRWHTHRPDGTEIPQPAGIESLLLI